MDCPDCGHEVAYGRQACGHCGRALGICWHCGRPLSSEDTVCAHCGKVFWTRLLTPAVLTLLAFIGLVCMLGSLSEGLIRLIVPDRFPLTARIALVVGAGAALSGAIHLRTVAAAVAQGWSIRRRFSDCDALPPRHDCPDWEYERPGSCVQIGRCRACGQEVRRPAHARWTSWDYSGAGSCMQARTCLRCGQKAARGPDHVWVSTGIQVGSVVHNYDEDFYRYETFRCRRCGATKERNLP